MGEGEGKLTVRRPREMVPVNLQREIAEGIVEVALVVVWCLSCSSAGDGRS